MGKGEVLQGIKELSVIELAELVKDLEKEFGISAAPVSTAPPASAAAGTTPTEAAAPVEEKTEFNVVLQEVGANKINVIKAVREVTSLGLREAKDLVESAPKSVKEGVSQAEADQAKSKLEEAGAKVALE